MIQLTDDEKYLWKGGTLEEYSAMAVENARDIAAVGFDPDRTYIFTDTATMDMLYPVVLKVQRHVTCSQVVIACVCLGVWMYACNVCVCICTCVSFACLYMQVCIACVYVCVYVCTCVSFACLYMHVCIVCVCVCV